MTYTLYQGDCLEILPTLAGGCVDTIITDPPYGLSFMGKEWDHGVPGVQFWQEALRVAKPGAMLLAFGGTRTFHRLTVAIEDAGWEVRDVLSWLYGSGFPKSLDISKAIDKAAGAEREVVGIKSDPRYLSPRNTAVFSTERRGFDDGTTAGTGHGVDNPAAQLTAPATPAAQQWHGWGTALKPAWEPIIMAMKPLDGTFAENAQRWGVAGLNVDGARIGTATNDDYGRSAARADGTMHPGLNGYGVANRAGHVQQPSPVGRWPANLLLDEEAAAALDAASGERKSGSGDKHGRKSSTFCASTDWESFKGTSAGGDTGGASRFFYVAKASRSERNAGLEGMEAHSNAERDGRNQYKNGAARNGSGKLVNGDGHITPQANHHPTVKPLALMQYLCRLTATPTGGVVLDPFCGSGTTGVACMLEGRHFIGIEKESEYVEIARRRIESVQPALVTA